MSQECRMKCFSASMPLPVGVFCDWERFKDHLDARLNGLRADMMKWMFLYWSGTVAAIIGMGYFGPK
jgi:hypothetical protein